MVTANNSVIADLQSHTSSDETAASNDDNAGQKDIRDNLRSEALRRIQSAVGSSAALTKADIKGYAAVLSESGLEQGGALSHETKMRWLQENISMYIPQVISEAVKLGSEFDSMIDDAKNKKWIGEQSAGKWKKRLKDENILWMYKKQFLTKKFPKYLKNWEKLHEKRLKAEEKVKKLKVDPNKIPEVAALYSSSFINEHFSARTTMVNNALAALAAHEKGKYDLFKQGQVVLENAVKRGVLAPHKVSVWMRRIFESNADNDLILDFLYGKGDKQLPGLISKWGNVRKRFDSIESDREDMLVPGFHFVSADTFLNWHYSARMAYVNEAEQRLKAPSVGRGIILDIRRELDMKDWGSAQYLIDRALAFPITTSEQKEVKSMQQYLTTQRNESMSDSDETPEDPNEDMFKAFAELQHIDPAVYNLYVRTASKGIGAFSTLAALMYNRCWCHKNAVIDEDDEAELLEKAMDETKEVVKHGHGIGYENNYVPGYDKDAIRNQNKGEWSPQVLHISNDPNSQNALASKCETQQNNHSFKYWTTLIPEGLSYAQHQYIVYNLNHRIKRGLRNGGRFSEGTIKTGKTASYKPSLN